MTTTPGPLRRYLDRPFTSVQLLVLTGGALAGFGLLMAASTTISAAQHDTGGALWSQLIKQCVFVVIGLVLFWLAARATPRHIRMLAYPLVIVAIALLVACQIPGIGVEINGARRWVALGPLQIQPSEIGKVALLLWGADLLARKQALGTLTRTRHVFVPLLPGAALFILLVMLGSDLGTTLCYLMVLVGLLWSVGVPLRWFAALVSGLVGFVAVIAVAAPWRFARLTTFIDPFAVKDGDGFHTVESLYALASGGIFGQGLGQGTSKYGWVPNASTDYVFSIIGEELGLLGCVVVLVLFGLFTYAGIRVSRRSVDPFVRIAAAGATVWIAGQAVINIGYVTGMLPSTGIPLPFISVGGTSLIMACMVLGFLVAFARHEPAAVAAARGAAAGSARGGRWSRLLRIPLPAVHRPANRRGRRARAAAAAASRPRPAVRVRPAVPAGPQARFAARPRVRTDLPPTGS